MKLYHAPTSPYVRKIMVFLHELEKLEAVEIETVTTTAFASDTALMAANPLAKIPALERPEGATLYDSRVITAYLDDLWFGGLYPKGAARWETLTLEATGDGIMDCTISMAYERRLRPEAEQSDTWVEAQWAKAERALDALGTRWLSHLSGPVGAGHISVGCALGYIDLRHDDRNWRQGREALAKWYEQFEQRPSMQATVPTA